jgi:hypothetical protein
MRTVLEANLVPLSLAQLSLELIHAVADSSPLPATVTVVVDDDFKFWRGLMMREEPKEASESSNSWINIAMESRLLLGAHSESRVAVRRDACAI